MIINFECEQCGDIFDCNVGSVSFNEKTFSPQFANDIVCKNCGKLSTDDVMLTEVGQGQLTQATLNIEPEEIIPFDDGFDEMFGDSLSGECQGCDISQSLNDIGLCDDCAEKLDRDLIRQRDWAYSSLAFGVPSSKYDELRKQIISRYGEKFELIAPPGKASSTKNAKKSKKKRAKSKQK